MSLTSPSIRSPTSRPRLALPLAVKGMLPLGATTTRSGWAPPAPRHLTPDLGSQALTPGCPQLARPDGFDDYYEFAPGKPHHHRSPGTDRCDIACGRLQRRRVQVAPMGHHPVIFPPRDVEPTITIGESDIPGRE